MFHFKDLIYLQVNVPGLVRADLVHRVDLVRDCRNVFARVRLTRDIKFIFHSQIRKHGEELLQGVVQVRRHVLLRLGVALVLGCEADP